MVDHIPSVPGDCSYLHLHLKAVALPVTDLGIAQIAAETGVAEGTVKSRLSRGRARLADLLDDGAQDKEDRHV